MIILTIAEIYREVMGVRIPGGSEDVMLDLAIREMRKNFHLKKEMLRNRSTL